MKNSKKLSIQRAEEFLKCQKIAKLKGGKCLSDTYINGETPMLWECKEGHQWTRAARRIKQDRWCPKCSKNLLVKDNENRIIHNKMFYLEECKKIAQERGGRCLSTYYTNNYVHLSWECSKGHQWTASPKRIKKGNWCPKCRKKRISIADCKSLAEKHGGKCLSNTYINVTTDLLWECNKKHQFKANWIKAKNKYWCKTCNDLAKITIEDMRNLAKKQGGQCLSLEYINKNLPLKWKCRNGHSWLEKPSKIEAGNWCPYCTPRKPLKEPTIQKLSPASLEVVSNEAKILWECKHGHLWADSDFDVQLIFQCPLCEQEKKEHKTKSNFIRKMKYPVDNVFIQAYHQWKDKTMTLDEILEKTGYPKRVFYRKAAKLDQTLKETEEQTIKKLLQNQTDAKKMYDTLEQIQTIIQKFKQDHPRLPMEKVIAQLEMEINKSLS